MNISHTFQSFACFRFAKPFSLTPASTPNSSGNRSFLFGRSIPGAKSPPSIQTCHWETRGDKGRQGETEQSDPKHSIQTRHGRQGETKGDKAKSSQPSIQTCHGREMKGDKTTSSQPSIQTRHGRQGETKGGGPASFLCKNRELLTARLFGE